MGDGSDDVRAETTEKAEIPIKKKAQIGVTRCRVNAREEEQMRVFYNSNLSFNRRLYEALDVALSPIRLSEPLEDLMKQPLLYARGQIPHACFQALTRFP